jgi:ketosteroid isomerase-like protein
VNRQDAREVIDTYIKAWETQDPGLIVTIFTESATYHERVLQDPIPDREAIRRYWQEKVVQSQANIKCELLNVYVDGDTVIAEWEAEFDDLAQGMRKRMREIAVLVFEGRLIASLREYWSSEQIGGDLCLNPYSRSSHSAVSSLSLSCVLTCWVTRLRGTRHRRSRHISRRRRCQHQ